MISWNATVFSKLSICVQTINNSLTFGVNKKTEHNTFFSGKWLAITGVFVFLFAIQPSTNAQWVLSLNDAVDSAMSWSPEIKKYEANLQQKEMFTKSSTGVFLPKVDLVGGYTFFTQNPEVNMSLVKESIDDVAGKFYDYFWF